MIILLPISLWGQVDWVCGNNDMIYVSNRASNCSNTSTIYNNYYKHKESYIPINGSNEDFIKTIHVSFHI